MPRKIPANQSPDPSPEEIRAACLLIQSEWSPVERRKREAWAHAPARFPSVTIRTGAGADG